MPRQVLLLRLFLEEHSKYILWGFMRFRNEVAHFLIHEGNERSRNIL